jgi:predicted PurR-regulated permease PerM
MLHSLINVFIEMFVSAIIAAAMTPLVNGVMTSRLMHRARWKPGRGLVVVATYLVVGVAIILFGLLVVRAIAREIIELAQNLPAYADAFGAWLTSLAASYPALQQLDMAQWIAANVETVMGALGTVLGGVLGVVSFTFGLFGVFITVIFITFMSLYLAMDAPRFRDYMVVFWPYSRQPQVSRLTNEMGFRLGHWAIGRSHPVFHHRRRRVAGLSLIAPCMVLLGIIWAIAEFIPGIGPFVSAVPSIALAFTVSPEVGIAAAIFTLVWSQVENNVITPKVAGSAVELHPLRFCWRC